MGDPACWLQRVCPSCGRMIEQPPCAGRCPYCSDALPDDVLEQAPQDTPDA